MFSNCCTYENFNQKWSKDWCLKLSFPSYYILLNCFKLNNDYVDKCIFKIGNARCFWFDVKTLINLRLPNSQNKYDVLIIRIVIYILITLFQHSDCSLPSLNSPTDSLSDEDQMSTFMSLQMDDVTDELAMKAPYIPMNIGADFPLLITDDLMWSASDRSPSKNSPDSSNGNSSSLAQLLCSNINKLYSNSNANDHGGGLLTIDKNYEDMYEKSKEKVCFFFLT